MNSQEEAEGYFSERRAALKAKALGLQEAYYEELVLLKVESEKVFNRMRVRLDIKGDRFYIDWAFIESRKRERGSKSILFAKKIKKPRGKVAYEERSFDRCCQAWELPLVLKFEIEFTKIRKELMEIAICEKKIKVLERAERLNCACPVDVREGIIGRKINSFIGEIS